MSNRSKPHKTWARATATTRDAYYANRGLELPVDGEPARTVAQRSHGTLRTLKYDTRCRVCGCELPAGTLAIWTKTRGSQCAAPHPETPG